MGPSAANVGSEGSSDRSPQAAVETGAIMMSQGSQESAAASIPIRCRIKASWTNTVRYNFAIIIFQPISILKKWHAILRDQYFRALIWTRMPLRGAMRCPRARWSPGRHFNPRSPCGGRRPLHGQPRRDRHISIHAPLAGSDRPRDICSRYRTYFNPRSPCGERQPGQPVAPRDAVVSIHAPLAGSDMTSFMVRRM